MSVRDFSELREHVGHKIECVLYGTERTAQNAAVECVTCGTVIVDFDEED